MSATAMENTGQYLAGTFNGRLPAELFDSTEMVKWIGGAVEREGHKFNGTVATRLEELGYAVKQEVNMTTFGSDASLGDVDVLAWSPNTRNVYVIECKRLLFARTMGEIGERLHEYTSVAPQGDKRTPIQKHLDRLTFLKAHAEEVARITNRVDFILKSALITDYLVPMQFSDRMAKLVDVVVDLDLIDAVFGQLDSKPND